MRERAPKILRWVLVTVGVIALTSFTVDATLNGNSLSLSALGILATSVSEEIGCPEGMIQLTGDLRNVCVDTYEASPGETCSVREVSNANHTRNNLNESSCAPVSEKSVVPWTFVTTHQARELCAKAGKRLITNREWYQAALGTPDAEGGEKCNIASARPARTGEYSNCVSPSGTYDMIGNVWEWVEGSVSNGEYGGRTLPESGYVTNADSDGVVLTTDSDVPSIDFHSDYFWGSSEGEFGMLRGGFHGSHDDAGQYSLQAKTAQSFTGAAIGFRCARDL